MPKTAAHMAAQMALMRRDTDWLVEFFSPDDDGTDRISRLESKIERILEKIESAPPAE